MAKLPSLLHLKPQKKYFLIVFLCWVLHYYLIAHVTAFLN
jgi:hypothetical protein